MKATDAPDEVGVIWIDARHAAVVRWDDEPVLEWIESAREVHQDAPIARVAARPGSPLWWRSRRRPRDRESSPGRDAAVLLGRCREGGRSQPRGDLRTWTGTPGVRGSAPATRGEGQRRADRFRSAAGTTAQRASARRPAAPARRSPATAADGWTVSTPSHRSGCVRTRSPKDAGRPSKPAAAPPPRARGDRSRGRDDARRRSSGVVARRRTSLDQVVYRNAIGDERIGDETPMTTPPERLSAHDRDRLAGASSSLERLQR